MSNLNNSSNGFPVVSTEVCNSIVMQLRSDKKYMDRLLDEIQQENPELGDFILSSANKFADNLSEKFDEVDTRLQDYVRGNLAWMMCAVYNSVKQQFIINDLNDSLRAEWLVLFSIVFYSMEQLSI